MFPCGDTLHTLGSLCELNMFVFLQQKNQMRRFGQLNILRTPPVASDSVLSMAFVMLLFIHLICLLCFPSLVCVGG